MSVEIDMKALLEAGTHFGHKTSRWHPKMAPYIHSKRDGAHIINLEKTVASLERALEFVAKLSASNKKILFVGTKKQLKELTKASAEAVDMPYVVVRWVGGTLTNVETVSRQIRKLKDYEKKMQNGELEARYSKLEVQRHQEEIDLLNERYGGIKELNERPAAILVTDANVDHSAIKEAQALHIPIIAFCDTNVDPSDIDYVIPMNDDSQKAEELVLNYFVTAIKEAKK